MSKPLKILFIEDVIEDYELIILELKRGSLNFNAIRVDTENKLTAEIDNSDYDLIISDNQLPTISASKSLQLVREVNEDIPFIIVSGSIGEEYAVELMRLGANDYILKSNLSRLIPVINREAREYELKKRQKRFSKELVLSELRFQNLTKSISDIFFAIDRELKITFWNAIAEKEFNRKVSIGVELYTLFPEWVDEDITTAIQEALRTNQPHSFKLKCFIDNKVEYFEGTVSSSGDGASVLLRKVTERHLNRKKLEKLNNELEILLYRISHDLKGPVTSVIGLLNVMKIAPDFDKVHFINMMTQRMNHLEKTLKVLRNVANIKYGNFEREDINVRKAILEIIEMISVNGISDNVKINFRSDERARYHGDILLFHSIIQNLIENAIKYGADAQGKVQIEIVAEYVDDHVFIRISDKGKGIPEHMHEDIFQMFYRGDEKSDGTGMGLYIVKHGLEKINGKIELDAEYKKGTRFRVTIPCKNEVLLMNK